MFAFVFQVEASRQNRHPENMARCQFREEINERGYTTFQSIANETHFLAFDKRGRAMKMWKSRRDRKSQEFLKLGTSFDISKHNAVVSGIKDGGSVPNKTRHNHARKRGYY